MKKLPFILFVFLYFQIAFAQNQSVNDRISVYLKDSSMYYLDEHEENWYIKYTYEYNERGVVSTSGYDYDHNGITFKERYSYSYTVSNKIFERFSEYYDQSLGWVLFDKAKNTYNENDILIESIFYSNTNEGEPIWTKYKKANHEIGLTNQKVSTIKYLWDETENDWLESSYEQFFYNDLGLLSTYRYTVWDEDLNEFVFSRKVKYEYNHSNELIKNEVFFWNENVSDWDPFSITDNIYENSLITESISTFFDEETEEWNPRWKHTHSYDENQNELVDSVFFWSEYYESWGYNKRTKNCYSEYEIEVTTLPEMNKKEILIFPNPTTGTIHLLNSGLYNFNSILIVNNLGQTVLKEDFKEVIDLQEVSRGMYYLVLLGETEQYAIKILKE